MNIKNLMDVFQDQLRDIYNAEMQLIEALPRMMDAATSSELKAIFQSHLEETFDQRGRVGQLLNQMNISAAGKVCQAMEGLIKEAIEVINTDGDSDARDAWLIEAAQKIEHYEIATYGTLRSWAITLGEHSTAEVLQTILNEEHDTNDMLSLLAQRHLNRDAVS
jgi:ferritin-like metal-binding protein YciE